MKVTIWALGEPIVRREGFDKPSNDSRIDRALAQIVIQRNSRHRSHDVCVEILRHRHGTRRDHTCLPLKRSGQSLQEPKFLHAAVGRQPRPL